MRATAKILEHEQASTRLNFASKSSKGKILRAVKNFNGQYFITPNDRNPQTHDKLVQYSEKPSRNRSGERLVALYIEWYMTVSQQEMLGLLSRFSLKSVCSCAAQRLIMYQTNAPKKNSTSKKRVDLWHLCRSLQWPVKARANIVMEKLKLHKHL